MQPIDSVLFFYGGPPAKMSYQELVTNFNNHNGATVIKCHQLDKLIKMNENQDHQTVDEPQYKYENISWANFNEERFENLGDYIVKIHGKEYHAKTLSLEIISCNKESVYRRIELTPEDIEAQEVEELGEEFERMLNDGFGEDDLARHAIKKLKG